MFNLIFFLFPLFFCIVFWSDINENTEWSDCDVYLLRKVLGKFGKHNLQRIMQYFPFKDKRFIAKKLESLNASKDTNIEWISIPRLECKMFDDFVKYV